jgi:hypothetical protein
MITGHGGDIFDKAHEPGCDPMENPVMSSNVNTGQSVQYKLSHGRLEVFVQLCQKRLGGQPGLAGTNENGQVLGHKA